MIKESFRIDTMREKIFAALIAAGTTETTKEIYAKAEKIALEYYEIRHPEGEE